MEKNNLPAITDRSNLKGVYVLLRAGLNVPIENGEVTNQFRIIRSLPTMQYLVEQGARVILCAHVGREEQNTLRPIYEVLKQTLPITFSSSVLGEETQQKRDALHDGEILFIENLRTDEREQANDSSFGKELAGLAEIYVNDAFSVSHRKHASIVQIPNYLPSYFGINFIHEYTELQKVHNPISLSLFILGGAKFNTKMPLVEKYVDIYDHVFIGGALANDFFKAKGYEIGHSLTSEIDISKSKLLDTANIILPSDCVVLDTSGVVRIAKVSDVHPTETILDCGPQTIIDLEPLTKKAKTILWNGPLGNYEKGFVTYTEMLAKNIAHSEAYTVVGGGDTIASIESLEWNSKYSFLSTGGGAMLDFLEHGTLPGIEAILASNA